MQKIRPNHVFMKNGVFILLLIVAADLIFTLQLVRSGEAAMQPERPSIFFIFADDWGWGDLSCHDNQDCRTPHLDRLASEGTVFRQFEVLSPVCSPSCVGMMTGRFPAGYCIHEHSGTPAMNRNFGQPDWLDPQAPTVAKFLNSAGYHDLGSDRPETNNVAEQLPEVVACLSKMVLDCYATLPLSTQVNPAFLLKGAA
jgi:Sulfatase